jgi:type VI secretion system protein ImpC
VELDDEIQLFVLDVTRAELDQPEAIRAALAAGGRDGTATVLVAGFSFGAGEADAATLAGLAALAAGAGAPLLAGAEGALFGCASAASIADAARWSAVDAADAARWRQLRQRPDARFVALAWPRFVLRIPYGKRSDPLESFAFEEAPAKADAPRLLWANPAFIAAALIADATRAHEAPALPDPPLEIADLPLVVLDEDGEKQMQPCTEGWLSNSAADLVLQQGINPLLGARDRNAVRLVRLQSIADPPAELAGPWDG